MANKRSSISRAPRNWRSSIDIAKLRGALFDPNGPGFAVLDCSALLQPVRRDHRALLELSETLSAIADPIVVFMRHGLWKKIPVSYDVFPHRVSGAGLIPMHIDCVNTENPPDVVVFFCERDDEDGGMSLVANFRTLKEEFRLEELNAVANTYIREGKFYDLDNVGSEYNPFPLLEYRHSKVLWIRHTGKLLLENPEHNGPLALNWVKRIDDALTSRAEKIRLTAGQALILNQHLCSHGRLPLRPLSESGRESNRTLWQCFFRAPSDHVIRCLLKPADISSL